MVSQDQGSNEGYAMFIMAVCGVRNRLLFPVIITGNGQQITYRQAVQKGLEVYTRFPWERKLLELRYYLTGSDYPRDPLFKLRPLEKIRRTYKGVRQRDIEEALEKVRQSAVFTLFQEFIVPTHNEITNLRAEHKGLQGELSRTKKELSLVGAELEQLWGSSVLQFFLLKLQRQRAASL